MNAVTRDVTGWPLHGAVGANYQALFRHSAVYVDEILKSARVKLLPVEQAAEFDLIATSRPPALSA